MNVIMKKVEAKTIDELKEDEVIEFVKEIIVKDGFPEVDMVKYVFFKDGFLQVTPEIPYVVTLDPKDGKIIVFYIATLNNCITLYNNLKNVKKIVASNNL